MRRVTKMGSKRQKKKEKCHTCPSIEGAIGCKEKDCTKRKGVERVTEYHSQALGKSEWTYCVTNRELLAVKYFAEYYKHYFLDQCFRVCSDYEALKWLFSLKEPKHRVARWIKALSEFDFEIEYWQGKKYGNADPLSQCPNLGDCSCPPGEESRLRCKAW